MFKKSLIVGVLALSLVLSGCYGSFQMTKKLYKWNGTLGDKYVKSIVCWVMVIVPVYAVAGFVDFIALNTIEFWTGNNPMALKSETPVHRVVTTGDKTYDVTMGNSQIIIREIAGPDIGKEITLLWNDPTNTWYLKDKNGAVKIASVDAEVAKLFRPDGTVETHIVTQ
jgi:hypothetical protein